MEIFPIGEQEKVLVLFRWFRLRVEHATANRVEWKFQQIELQMIAMARRLTRSSAEYERDL